MVFTYPSTIDVPLLFCNQLRITTEKAENRGFGGDKFAPDPTYKSKPSSRLAINMSEIRGRVLEYSAGVVNVTV